MMLSKLVLKNFRNYADLSLFFEKPINIFWGPNGSGKTNLLEAIYLLNTTKSFRGVTDNFMVQKEKPFFLIKGTIEQELKKLDSVSEEVFDKNLSIYYQSNKTKKFFINRERIGKAKLFFGSLPSVVILPEDLKIIDGSPEFRRRFLDNLISKVQYQNNVYFDEIIALPQLLKQRNALLKTLEIKKQLDLFYTINKIYLPKIWKISIWRKEFIEKLFQSVLIQNLKDLNFSLLDSFLLQYHSNAESFFPEFFSMNESDFVEKYSSVMQKELKWGQTLIGPHRDDLKITVHDQKASTFLSQGQKRIVAIAFRLTELQLVYSILSVAPILLVDDVISELDKERRNQLMNALQKAGQTFFTTTDAEFISHYLETVQEKTMFYQVSSHQVIPTYGR